MTEEQRRESERQAAQARAESASTWLLNKLGDMQDPGGVIQLDWKSVQDVAVAVIGSGAAQLINPTPVSESERAQNRRVEFIVTGIDVNAVQPLDAINTSIGG